MSTTVPITVERFGKFLLVNFSLTEIDNLSKVENAYLLLKLDRNYEEELPCFLNDSTDYKSLYGFQTSQKERYYNLYDVNKMIDITENFHLLLSGMKNNRGIVVEIGESELYGCQLQLTYKKEVISPQCYCNPFFSKKLFISSRSNQALSPFFLTAYSSMVTYCIHNLGNNEVTLHIQNSPDTKECINDKQSIILLPNSSGTIIPMIYTKYTRILITSAQPNILVKVWFQTQLIH